MIEEVEEKTIGHTHFIYCSEIPLFQISAGVPVKEALEQASDLLSLAKALAEDAAFMKETDRYAWASHFLTEMGKAVIDDVVKAVSPRPKRVILKAAT
jgi:translation elongation factor EF-G